MILSIELKKIDLYIKLLNIIVLMAFIKFRDEILDKNGWINQSYTNPKIPGSSIIFGRTNSEGNAYYRVIF